MKYKIGDKVRVIPDLKECDPRFGAIGVEEEMAAFRGKKVTITHLYESEEYLISEDGEEYVWAEEMFSEIADFTRGDLRSGMVAEVRNGNRYLVLKDGEDIYMMNALGMTHLDGNHDEHLRYWDTDFDIVKVFDKVVTFESVKTTTDLLWERKEPKKMTIAEIQKQLGYVIEIVSEAR